MQQDVLAQIMAEAIGPEQAQKAAQALVDSIGGSRIDIPKGDMEKRNVRNRQIKSLYRQGVGFSFLADRFAMSEKSIRRIVKAS